MHWYFRQPGNTRNIHREPPGKRRDVARAVCPSLKHEPFRIARFKYDQKQAVQEILYPSKRIVPAVGDAEYRKRHPNFAVKAFFALAGVAARGEHAVDSVFGRGFTDASRNRHHLGLVLTEHGTGLERKQCNYNFLEKGFHLSGGMS